MSNHNLPRVDLYQPLTLLEGGKAPRYWRWRLWKGSRIVGGSTESYTERRGALENLTTVLGGEFRKVSDAQFPHPFGLLSRIDPATGEWSVIPVRLK